MRRLSIFILAALAPVFAMAQPTNSAGPLTLRECIDYSLENNAALRKDRLGIESAIQSRREILGSLLPQVSASGSMTYNIQKTAIAMPNFVNSMMPEAMRDPNAAKYMTVTMGMDLSANWGVALSQQILNISLFEATQIAKQAEEMARMGVDADMNDVLAKTATLFTNAQILQYSLGLFDESLGVMTRLSDVMEANREIGLVKNVDADRIAVTKMNLETEKNSLIQAFEVQMSLLKLELGFPMNEPLAIEPLDIDALEKMLLNDPVREFVLDDQIPVKMLKQQQNMLELQKKAAIGETLPVINLVANYSQNYMGDHFYGETYHHFPVSMVSLNVKVPLFTGMSKNAKIKKAGIELQKAREDENMLMQSLTMGYNNARMQLDQSRSSLESQKRNQKLAQDVMNVTESNYNEGIATLTDLLNASSSLIQARMNYISTLNTCVKSLLDLKKADGTINEIIR